MNERIEQLQSLLADAALTYWWQLAIALLVIGVLVVWLLRRQPSSVPAFQTDSGMVRISRGAIGELVQTACEQIRGIRKPKIRLTLKRSRLDVAVHIKLESDTHLGEFAKILQNHIKEALRINLGIEGLRNVDILVTGFRSGQIKQSAVAAKKGDTAVVAPDPVKESEDGREPEKPFYLESDSAETPEKSSLEDGQTDFGKDGSGESKKD